MKIKDRILKSKFLFRLNHKFPIFEIYSYHKQNQNKIYSWYIEKLSFFSITISKKHSNGVLLIEKTNEYDTMIKMAAASKSYCTLNNLYPLYYFPLWTRRLNWIDKKKDIYHYFFKNKSDKFFNTFSNKTVFSGENDYFDQTYIDYLYNEIILSIKKPTDVLKISIKGIVIGDLIYDTYLRFFSIPTLNDINDSKLHLLIRTSINLFCNFEKTLDLHNVKALFTNHSVYIHSGIYTRLSLSKGIKVYSFGLPIYMVNKVTTDFPFHVLNFHLFNKDLKISKDNLKICNDAIESRLSGVIDKGISYMSTSPYTETKIEDNILNKFIEFKRNVIIYAHDFYDAPHIVNDLKFTDYYSWMKNILDNIKQDKDSKYWIKRHPNSISNSDEKLIELVSDYSLNNISILPKNITNFHVINYLKPDLVVTASGTIGLEFAYVGIPVVAINDNQYINFNFLSNCNSLEEYYSIITGQIIPKVHFDLQEILSFYYQAYYLPFHFFKEDTCNLLNLHKKNQNSIDLLEILKESEDLIFNNEIIDSYNSFFLKN